MECRQIRETNQLTQVAKLNLRAQQLKPSAPSTNESTKASYLTKRHFSENQNNHPLNRLAAFDNITCTTNRCERSPLIEMRPHLTQAKYGEMTQGTVFTCATASRYHGCRVYGLAITARCDFAQRKYPVLNFVPIVELQDWLLRDGLDILIEQEKSEQNGQLKSMLKKAQISEALPNSVPILEIARTSFPRETGTKSQKSTSTKFHELTETIIDFENTIKTDNSNKIYEWIIKHREKQINELIKRLSRHSVLGHYFLETLEVHETKKTGYVCLLREISTIPRIIAEKLGKGIDLELYNEHYAVNPHGSKLEIRSGELAMPIIEISSPTLEHILQSLGNLFGRIGVSEPNVDTIATIIAKCTGMRN